MIEYFYKKNEKINLPHSFHGLISKQKAGQLPDELSKALSNSLVPILPASHRHFSLNCCTASLEPLRYQR